MLSRNVSTLILRSLLLVVAICMRVAPILLRWPRISEVGVGAAAAEAESSPPVLQAENV